MPTPESSIHLLDRIRLGEDSLLELKRVAFRGSSLMEPAPDSLAQELAAFANSKTGGTILLGVDDRTRDITGLPTTDLDRAEEAIRNICQDRIDPPLVPIIEKIELPDSSGQPRPLIKISISRSLFVHRAPGGHFIRIGSSKRPLSQAELERLIQQRSQSRLILFDEQPVPATSPDDLDPALSRRFLDRAALNEIPTLKNLGILAEDTNGDLRITVAGCLVASTRPDLLLHSGARIEAVAYAGTKQDSNQQLDARTITGPADTQILDAFHFCIRNMATSATKAPARVETPQFSHRAVFEALVNAVAHRDYSIAGSKIRLFLFEDRMELYSPGGLPNTLTLQSMALRQFTRNETLVGLLNRLPVNLPNTPNLYQRVGQFLETRGDGVKIILDETLALCGQPATYRLIDDSELLLTLPAAGGAV
jgi:predicted HTH transcriptional regulator